MNSNKTLLEGIISIKAAIDGKSRKIDVVYIDLNKRKQRDRKIMWFISFLKEREIPFQFVSREEIDGIVWNFSGDKGGNSHGGVVAVVSNKSFAHLDQMINGAMTGDYYVFLDGVEDPYNLGYCVRAFFAMGAKGFILPERDLERASNVISRASAGAWELCQVAYSHDDETTVTAIMSAGLDIVCSALSEGSVPIGDFKPQRPFVLVIGGEKRGISPKFMENAKKIVHIPYANELVRYSLTATSVCSMYALQLYDYAMMSNTAKNYETKAKEQKCSDM